MPVRLVGVYEGGDGKGYRCYRNVEAFLDNELTSKNRGKWFYAHAGGLADFQFLLQKLIERKGYRIKASCSGSSLIIVHVSRGKNSWHFIDSFWLLKDKLRSIGKYVGISKGNEDESEEFYRDASFETLREYNEIDCVILYRAIEQFEEALWELGGLLKMTQASCAMELFRRRFLKRSIETSSLANLISRESYFASRVEVFSKSCDNAWYYDVNSSFPYAMTFPIPGEMTHHVQGRMPNDYDRIFTSDVEISVPDCVLPPMPTRMGGRLFFPTGSWRGWFTSIDLELLERVGGKITRVHETLAFEKRDDLAEYATTLYDLRAKSAGTFMDVACKYLMNSVYGKFAECDMKSGIEIDPVSPGSSEEGWEMLFPGCFVHTHRIAIPHEHVPISAHITAIGRRTLFDYMSQSSEVHYCDTDGFSSSDQMESVEGVLGAIKLEKRIRHGEFVTQKVYKLEGEELKKGVWSELGEKGIKAKGFSRMTHERFQTLIEGGDIEYSRMARSRELLRRKQIVPREQTFKKHLHKDTIPKRFFYPDGESRPWSVEELLDMVDAKYV